MNHHDRARLVGLAVDAQLRHAKVARKAALLDLLGGGFDEIARTDAAKSPTTPVPDFSSERVNDGAAVGRVAASILRGETYEPLAPVLPIRKTNAEVRRSLIDAFCAPSETNPDGADAA